MKHCHLYITANPISVKNCFSSYISKCSWPIRLEDYLKCNLKKFIFCMSTDIKVSYKEILLFWHGRPDVPKVPKITSLQYLSD